MRTLIFPLNPFIHPNMAGHFISPSANWKHMSRTLGDYELIMVTKGTLYIANEENHYTIAEGEYLIMPPTKHQYGYQPSSCQFYWLHFSFSPQSGQKEIRLAQYGKIPNFSRMAILFSQFHDLMTNCQDNYTIDLFATGLLLELHRQQENLLSQDASKGFVLYQKIREYIIWNSSYQLTVKHVAKQLGYHPKYISNIFRKFHSCSLKQYMMQQIMEHAKSELAYTTRTISEIAEDMGFQDAHNFSSAFRHVVGVSPSHYRNSFSQIPPNYM